MIALVRLDIIFIKKNLPKMEAFFLVEIRVNF